MNSPSPATESEPSAAGASADGPTPEDAGGRALGWSLFALSFAALFLELMFIRWVPSVVKIVAYYANLMLISSFLGLGLGALLASRHLRLFRFFPIVLTVAIGFLLACREVILPASEVEYRFFAGASQILSYGALIGIFLLNAAVFVPLGERVGRLFNNLPPLRAYAWDLGGSLCGTIFFGLFSYFSFSPLLGIAGVMVVFLVLADQRSKLWALPAFAAVLVIVALSTQRDALWSPYHYITVHELGAGDPDNPTPAPRPERATLERQDPPLFQVRVNQMFYQIHGSIDRRRYSDWNVRPKNLEFQYGLPYAVRPNPEKVVVVGAGGGTDVEAALLAGATSVDAVEIDPILIELARHYNASGSYKDPRVTVRADDARAFLQRTQETYDVIVFGFLDSQALSSSMASIRLDGFVYTVESFRTAWNHLSDDGMLALSFYIGNRPGLIHKLVGMIVESTGTEPLLYIYNNNLIACVPRGEIAAPPETFGPFKRFLLEREEVPLATDDWPYLYLARQTIPEDYATVMGILLVLSVVGLLRFKAGGMGLGEWHFFFLGAGFLLLQTKSIIDCSLYFGATWLVTTVVVAGVLLMVLLANLVAFRLRTRKIYYLGLFASFLVLYVVPNETVLALPMGGRLLFTLLVVPLPIFFAGIIFSTTFRRSARPSASFGANLVGATVGGFLEYLGMAVGYHQLSLLVLAAYLASLLCRLRTVD